MSLCPTIEKTEAIALRVSDFSNTSQMVAWLTSDGRRLVTSAKGALRPRSPFLGQYDLGYTCEILYYSHGGTGAVHVLHECTPLDARASLRARWRSALSAEYALDLLGQVAATAPANPAFYALLRATLDHLVRRGTSAAALLAFESLLNFLRLSDLKSLVNVDLLAMDQAAQIRKQEILEIEIIDKFAFEHFLIAF